MFSLRCCACRVRICLRNESRLCSPASSFAPTARLAHRVAGVNLQWRTKYHMERVVSGLRSLIEGPLATGSDRAEELNGRGLEANRHGDTSAALGFFLEAHVRGLFPSPRG